MNDFIRTAVITGGHDFEVIPFHQLFRSFSDVDAYIQHLEHFAASSREVRESYDVIVFFSQYKTPPAEEEKVKTVLEELGATKQGIVVLHHAVLSYQGWSLWQEIADTDPGGFAFHDDQQVDVQIADPLHPITTGLEPWTMQDETYEMNAAGPNSHVLLRTTHEKSAPNLAWTREYHNSRVFCFMSGHDHHAWENPNFGLTLHRGIQWTAGRL